MSTDSDPTTDAQPIDDHPDRIGIDEHLDRAVRYIERGYATVEDVAPEAYHEMDADEFREQVRERLDDDSDDETVAEPDGEPTSDPREIDWAAMLEAANLDADAQLSTTQWQLVIDISDQTRIGHDGAADLLARAEEAGQIQAVAIGAYDTHVGGSGPAYEYRVSE